MLIGYQTALYHVTPKRLLPHIRREGLKPHVPGKLWGASDPSATERQNGRYPAKTIPPAPHAEKG
jgi:hypothetical protein